MKRLFYIGMYMSLGVLVGMMHGQVPKFAQADKSALGGDRSVNPYPYISQSKMQTTFGGNVFPGLQPITPTMDARTLVQFLSPTALLIDSIADNNPSAMKVVNNLKTLYFRMDDICDALGKKTRIGLSSLTPQDRAKICTYCSEKYGAHLFSVQHSNVKNASCAAMMAEQSRSAKGRSR